ncbi:SCO family protein [Temperatibacter marinus]|uniref:SCO family protein n=1 Tax=Temperatibacter marinus TaxID=1456591 RepID=A0AA52EKD3_9PROT|nr:SCO family protein [Temperatibacter marinus]WND04137.1 SCO family protein [Temperatibacter marinus]
MKVLRYILWSIVILVTAILLGQVFSQKKDSGRQILSSGDSIGGSYTLTAHTGVTVKNTDFKGKFQFIYFGYSFCPDVCPIELQKMTAALKMMEEKNVDTSAIQPLFITVDPERDTVAELANFMPGFHPNFIGLTSDLETIQKVAPQYKIYFTKTGGTGNNDYLVNHSNYIILMNKEGSFLKLFTAIDTPQQIATTLTQLVQQ